MIKPPYQCHENEFDPSQECALKPKQPNLQKSVSHRNLAGQFYQAEYVENLLRLKNHSNNKQHANFNGFFIEAGAGDGEIISNSLYFELMYKVFFVMKNKGLWGKNLFFERKVINLFILVYKM